MKIKKAAFKYASRISYLIHKLTDMNPNKYSKKQIAAWKKYNTPARIRKQMTDREIFCIFNNTHLIGTIALNGNEVAGFYVSPNKQNKGIGTELLSFIENRAKLKEIKTLKLTSTPSAYNFYIKRGYKPKGKVIHKIFNISFPEIKLEKIL